MEFEPSPIHAILILMVIGIVLMIINLEKSSKKKNDP